MIRSGDILLTKKLGNPISELLAGWTNSKFSHVVPIVHSIGLGVNAILPRCQVHSIERYFTGKHRVKIIRPKRGYTGEELSIWVNTARQKDGKFYDILAPFGFVFNKLISRPDWWTCAELVLDSEHSIGRLKDIEAAFITPHTFDILARAGLYEIVFEDYKPSRAKFKKFMEGENG